MSHRPIARPADPGLRLGKTLPEFFRTDDPDYPPIAAHRRALHGARAGYEIAAYGRVFDACVVPLRDPAGRIAGCLGLGIDITARRRMEEELRASKARFQAIYRHAGTGMVIADLARRIRDCNPAFVRFLGYSVEELRGRRFPLATHTDDVARDRQLFRELVAGARDAYTLEKRYVRRNGGVVWGRLVARTMGK